MTLTEFADTLERLKVGSWVALTYTTFAEFFPPGHLDGAACDRAYLLARLHGCETKDEPAEQWVKFTRMITHPTWAPAKPVTH